MALRFPHDLPDKYYTSIGFEAYTRPDPFSSLVTLTQVTGDGSIQLPIPQNIIDSQHLKWGQSSALLGDTLIKGWDALTETGDWSKLGNNLAAGAIGAPSAIGGAIGAALGGGSLSTAASNGARVATGASDVAKAVLQQQGLALNPVLSIMFEQPEFKAHSFMWKFAPESPEESKSVASIIEAFRFNALPDVQNDGLFFKYPSIVRARLRAGDGDIYRMQPCIMTSVEVNYAANPAQTPSFFNATALPTVITLKIELLEIIMNTRKNTKPNSSFTNLSFGSGLELNSVGMNSIQRVLTSVNGLVRK